MIEEIIQYKEMWVSTNGIQSTPERRMTREELYTLGYTDADIDNQYSGAIGQNRYGYITRIARDDAEVL